MEIAELIYNPVFKDNRGTFAPLPLKFGEGKLGILQKEWLQSNLSVNPKKWTLRGLHYQSEPYAQTKLVKVITGNIIDFVVDLRVDSEDFGKCFIFEVGPNNELYVPKGFAHGFITIEDNTVVQYLVDEEYYQPKEGSISWESIPLIVETLKNKIDGFNPDDILISEKDKVCQTITEYMSKFENHKNLLNF
jgi:dTDP-4-dehydrorhamnose 3,5-epimerase